MAKRTKLDTMDLIRQMTEKKEATDHVLTGLKNERTLVPTVGKQHFEPENVREVKEKSPEKGKSLAKRKKTAERNELNSTKLEGLLNAKKRKDKKDSFMFTLNRDILVKYEKLAVGISYKLDSKVTRNQLMRQILDDFIRKNYAELKLEIDQK